MINFQGFAKVYWLTGVEVGPSPYTSEITGAYVTYSGKRLVMYQSMQLFQGKIKQSAMKGPRNTLKRCE